MLVLIFGLGFVLWLVCSWLVALGRNPWAVPLALVMYALVISLGTKLIRSLGQ